MVEPIKWENRQLVLLDQTRLPLEVKYLTFSDYRQVALAITEMRVRGAPAIGAAAAFGLVLAALEFMSEPKGDFAKLVRGAAKELAATRPTAVNLFWALNRMLERMQREDGSSVAEQLAALEQEALDILSEDVVQNRRIGCYGSELVPPGANILTHCNAGALATGGYGTALGVIRAAHAAGKNVHVYADETRPLLQGARLTVWELHQEGIPVTLVTDNMAGYLMALGKVDLVLVGADRITANGDVANKIGTYGLAVLAKHHGIPFYVAAPLSTFDFTLPDGSKIPIEERLAEEVTSLSGRPIAPPGARVFNPAFDITPHNLITAIITDRGVIRPPYQDNFLYLRASSPVKNNSD